MQQYKQGILKNLIVPKPYTTKRGVFDNNIFCFDIETSSAWVTKDLKVIPFDKTKYTLTKDSKKDYNDPWKHFLPISLCYIWQFGVNDTVLYGRKLEEFLQLLNELKELVESPTIWVHNLAYEFQFLLNILQPTSMFARKSRKPMYFEWESIKFRCSYMLTRLSLASWGKQVGEVKKMEGYLDYTVLRTPTTILTSEELGYCENDILVMYHGIKWYLKKYHTIENIPITQTGEVRRPVQHLYNNDYNHHLKMTKLLPRNKSEYIFMKDAFMGGYTHANKIHARRIISNVKSKDIASSYPYVMLAEKYPSTNWFIVRPYEINDYRNEDYSLLLDVTFIGLKAKTWNTYISVSKCKDYDKDKLLTDNGRVISSPQLSMRCTNIDLDIIEKAYDIKEIRYNKILASKNEYLDSGFMRYILELYGNKTVLKGNIEYEDLYMQSKQFINALYGMKVTDIVNESWEFINYKWVQEHQDIDKVLDELRNKPYKNYLSYQHGVWVTAYARRALWDIILQIDKEVVYVDTDSVKYIGEHENVFIDYNERATQKLRKALEYNYIPFELSQPSNQKGETKPIGIYETEKPYKQFKTLGAKRYAFTHYDSDEIFITVSGVNKEKGRTALKSLKEFDDDFVFDSDHTGKLLLKYLDDMPPVLWNEGKYDEYYSTYQYGVNAQPTTYSLSMADEYIELIKNLISQVV